MKKSKNIYDGDIKHVIISRCNFNDVKLMDKYLKITKDVLVPCLKKQRCQNFKWLLKIKDEHIDYVKNYLNYDFEKVNQEDIDSAHIQTRHDIDDWISDKYIQDIQKIFREHINDYKIILIHSQPKKYFYKTKKEVDLHEYTNRKLSMHLSLGQLDTNHSVHSYQHGQMYKLTDNIIKLPGDKYTKWVIHGNNISYNRNRKR